MSRVGRHRLLAVASILLAACCTSPTLALFVKQLAVPHINAGDYPQAPDSGAISAWMTLQYLANGNDAYIGPDPSAAIYGFGRSLQPQGWFGANTLRDTLNHYAAGLGYSYEIIHGADFDSIVGQIALGIARENPDSAPYPANAPVLLPLYGEFSRWVVMTGVYSDSDPALVPGAVTRGVWLDDPLIYNDPMFPVETNAFYSCEASVANGFGSIFLPMAGGPYAGEYVALIATPIPLPGAALLGVHATLVMLVASGLVRRR